MGNSDFIDTLISDVGLLTNSEELEGSADMLDVLKVMIFTNLLGPINRKVKASVDGESFMILLVEEAFVSLDKEPRWRTSSERSFESSISSSEEGDDLVSDTVSFSDRKLEMEVVGEKQEGGREETRQFREYNGVRSNFSRNNVDSCINPLHIKKGEIVTITEEEGHDSEQMNKSRKSDTYSDNSISRVACSVEKANEHLSAVEAPRVEHLSAIEACKGTNN